MSCPESIFFYLGKLEVDINGKRQVLLTDSAAMTVDIIENFAKLVINSYQFYTGVGLASTDVQIMTGAAIGLHSVTTIGTVLIKVMSEEEIKLCREQLNEIAKMGGQITGYKKQRVHINRWLIRARNDLNSRD